jgi:hypothetical protein
MNWTFDSAGTVTSVFNSAMAPGAPATYPAKALLIIGAAEFAGSDAPPTISGWTRITLNSLDPVCALWMKIATGSNGSDTMPSFTWGTQFASCGCVAYDPGFALTSLPTVDVQAEKGANLTSGMTLPGIAAPSQNNALMLNISMRNNGSATGVSISNVASFIQRLSHIPNASGRPLYVVQDWIQTTATGMSQTIQATSPADSAAETGESQTVALLLPAASAPVPFPPTSLGGMNVQVCQ